jgi:hypothetical protein
MFVWAWGVGTFYSWLDFLDDTTTVFCIHRGAATWIIFQRCNPIRMYASLVLLKRWLVDEEAHQNMTSSPPPNLYRIHFRLSNSSYKDLYRMQTTLAKR